MDDLQDNLDRIQDLLDNNALSAEEAEHLSDQLETEHENYCGWVMQNYFRKPFSYDYLSKQDGSGDYASKDLRILYKARRTRAEVKTKKVGTFFDWAFKDTTERTFDQLAKIYSKLK